MVWWEKRRNRKMVTLYCHNFNLLITTEASMTTPFLCHEGSEKVEKQLIILSNNLPPSPNPQRASSHSVRTHISSLQWAQDLEGKMRFGTQRKNPWTHVFTNLLVGLGKASKLPGFQLIGSCSRLHGANDMRRDRFTVWQELLSAVGYRGSPCWSFQLKSSGFGPHCLMLTGYCRVVFWSMHPGMGMPLPCRWLFKALPCEEPHPPRAVTMEVRASLGCCAGCSQPILTNPA